MVDSRKWRGIFWRMVTTIQPTPDAHLSCKMRADDNRRIRELAERFETNGLEILTAMRIYFEEARDLQKLEAIQKAQRLYPSNGPRRVGRGNRRLGA